jgi:putative transposase
MKTVPTLHVAAQADTINFCDVPDDVCLVLADVAGAAREGLLAMSVATGLAVMQAMFEAEITAITGPRGKHDPDRVAVRHGSGRGSVTLGGRRVPVDRPRARSVDGHEVPLPAYGQFAADDQLSAVVLERMLAGVATRRHARVAEPVGEQVETTDRHAKARW